MNSMLRLLLCKVRARKNRILFLIDLDNLSLNVNPTITNLGDALDKVVEKISQTGRVVKICAFASEQSLTSSVDILRSRGVILVQCPKIIIDKTGARVEKQDTVDPELIRVGTIDINEMTNLTHLAIGSGDQDFEGFVRWAKAQSLGIIVVAGDRRSLSHKISDLASFDSSGKKMVYLLSQGER